MKIKWKLLAFFLVAALLFGANAFPSLYGDEYGSLFESRHLLENLHAFGYFLQLRAWSEINGSDGFLRLLSLLWFGMGLYGLGKWTREENFASDFFLWLVLLNPYLWIYGFQIRFYAMFFAASVWFAWRLRAWQKERTKANALWLAGSAAALLSSHLFGWLAAGTILFAEVWKKTRRKLWLGIALLAVFAVLLIPSARGALIEIVYRFSNPYAEISEQTPRGISLGMLAKIPLTFYFFALGERVYPLWLWITLPAMLILGAAFSLGLWNFRKLGEIGALALFMLLNVPLLYLVLDPLAPPSLQGAAPRYLIFILPYFLLILAHGAEQWKPLQPALIAVQLAGLYFLAFPSWSYGGSDLVHWQKILAQAVPNPAQTCVVVEGRAASPVRRYLPGAGKIVLQQNLSECEGFDSVALVSNHFDLGATRYLDSLAETLSATRQLTANVVVFPAHVTVYQKSAAPQNGIVPSRLSLPEQDLTFPIDAPRVQGFSRLDSQRPAVAVFAPAGNIWILSNYRSDSPLEDGTPVFRLTFDDGAELTLRSGVETAAWDGFCASCFDAYSWTKRLHLVGSYSYPGAYRQYQAHIWGYEFSAASNLAAIEYLPAQGTGYFYGVLPRP